MKNGTVAGIRVACPARPSPLAARIFAVVDVWDALSNDRPYRKSLPPEDVYQHLQSLSGSHFDPDVLSVFLELLHETKLQNTVTPYDEMG